MKVFITGATGVIGRRAVPLLVAAGHAVTAVERSCVGAAHIAHVGAQPIELDLFDARAVRAAVAGHEAVINLATHMPRSTGRMLLPWAWRENDRIRREGSAALVDAAIDAEVSRFIQESFAPVYEDGGEGWIDEIAPVRPAPYNHTVLDAERSAARFAAYGGTGIVLRFAAFYGADQSLRDVVKVVRSGWSPLPGSPNAYWSSVAHVDAAAATVAVLDAPSGLYNICDDDPLTRREWAAVVAAAIGAPPPKPMPHLIATLGGKTAELLSRSQRLSNGKLKSATGWQPKWPSAREGLPAAIKQLA
jgi:nucleoside-diphosphate-sugar epimerase